MDGQSIEAIIRCEVDQIEKLKNVKIELPTISGQPQTVDLGIPQIVSWRLHERFRWPSDQVMLLSCGVVATPGGSANRGGFFESLLSGSRGRADALMFVEYKGLARGAPISNAAIPNPQIPPNARR